MTGLRLLLDEFIPQIIIVRYRFESRRQTETMSVRREEFHAKRVDRSKKRTAKRFHDLQRQPGFEDSLARSLLHFIGSAIRVGYNNELRQPFERALPIFRDFNDPISDRLSLARASGSDDREVSIQFPNKSLACVVIGNGRHFACPSSSSTNAGWVSAHFSSSKSVSIGSVASGYFPTNPKSA